MLCAQDVHEMHKCPKDDHTDHTILRAEVGGANSSHHVPPTSGFIVTVQNGGTGIGLNCIKSLSLMKL